jgi:hypothetical protein
MADTAAPKVRGVTDTTKLTLVELAEQGSDRQALSRLLPMEDLHLPVCAFGSCI